MKKIMILAASAALVLAGCAKNDVYQNTTDQNAVSFGVYAGNTATKATYGDLTTANIKESTDGFGVFDYYTQNTAWASAASSATPNFMYNQKVKYNESANTTLYPAKWEYTPLKYWPNGTNDTEVTSGTYGDYITFFAYAPHTAVTPSTGIVVDATAYPSSTEGVTAVSTNAAPNVPTVMFTVPANAKEQIDLLWATPMQDQQHMNLSGKVAFTFNHALAKLNVQVRNVVDAVSSTTPTANITDDKDATLENNETWVILQSLTVKANGTKTGTLNLNDGTWTSTSGNSIITYDTDAFNLGKSGATWNYDANDNTITVSADSKEGFKVIETALDLNSNISPMIIPITADGGIAIGDFIITADYWVITKDPALASGYSTVHQVITKSNTAKISFAAGKKHNILVDLGLNSVDFNVTAVTPWDAATPDPYNEVELPANAS